MNSRAFLALLLTAISVSAVIAAQPVRPDDQKAREKKQEGILTTLLARCQTMLDLQTAVHKDTVCLYKIIEGTADKKPRPEDKMAALKLADKMKEIVKEATRACEMLEGESVAFPEVFQQVRNDMKQVQARLEKGDAGAGTLAFQADIIENLKEMVGSLGRSR